MGFLDRFRRKNDRDGPAVGTGAARQPFACHNGDLASNETIFSAISMLSGAIASAPITLRQDYRRVTPAEHPIARLLEHGPNSNMTAFQFIRSMEVLRNATGAGNAVKELDAHGGLSALWLMKTACVTPLVEQDSRELYYRIRDETGGDLAVLHHTQVLAVTHIGADPASPLSPIEVLRSSLDYDREVKEFSVDQMRMGLRAKMAINTGGLLNRQQLEEYNEIIRQFMRSGVLYLDKTKSVTELRGLDPIDPKVFEVENITIARVARVFNIPLEKFLPDKTSYSSAEQSDLNYLRDTILPMARMYEQEFSCKLLTEQERAAGMQIKFSLNGFARADMRTRGEFYMKGVRTGWFCLDDVRALEDLPPLPDGKGKVHYVSRDLVPIDQAGNTAAGSSGTTDPSGQIARVSLNGAQISSILEVIQSVRDGTMDDQSAVRLLTSAFPFDENTARNILGKQTTGGVM